MDVRRLRPRRCATRSPWCCRKRAVEGHHRREPARDLNATDEEVREAAHLACADEFVDGFPKGYDTWISRAAPMSRGGQKQRLCIARALLRRPKILILDDSTSAVDTKTDAKIRAGLGKPSAQHDQAHHRPAH